MHVTGSWRALRMAARTRPHPSRISKPLLRCAAAVNSGSFSRADSTSQTERQIEVHWTNCRSWHTSQWCSAFPDMLHVYIKALSHYLYLMGSGQVSRMELETLLDKPSHLKAPLQVELVLLSELIARVRKAHCAKERQRTLMICFRLAHEKPAAPKCQGSCMPCHGSVMCSRSCRWRCG